MPLSVTSNSVTSSVQTGTNFRLTQTGNNVGPVVVFNLSQSGTNIGLNLPRSDVPLPYSGLYDAIDTNLVNAGATNVSTSGVPTMVTNFTTSSVFTSNPGTSITFTGIFLIQGIHPTPLGTNTATVTFVSAVNTNQTTASSTAVAVNKTGETIIVNGVEYADNAEIGIIGENASGVTTTWTIPVVTISTAGYVETKENLSYILNQQFTNSLSTLDGALVRTITPPESVSGGFISAEMSSNYIITRLRIPNLNTGYYVQIYKTTTGDWTDTELLHTINQNEQHQNGQYGYALAISNDYFVVGDYRAMKVFDASLPLNSRLRRDGNGSGKVFVYDTITGNLLHTLTNPNDNPENGYSGTEAFFGFKVAISGKYIIVSAPREEGFDFTAPVIGIYNTEEELLSRSKEP